MILSGDGRRSVLRRTIEDVQLVLLVLTAWLAASLPAGLVIGRVLGARSAELELA